MSLVKELLDLNEAAIVDAMMDTICHACKQAKCAGVSYDDAVKNIMTEFRKLDQNGRVQARWLGNKFHTAPGKEKDSSSMSDEALMDLVQAFYNMDVHLDPNKAITSYRDVHFSRQGNGPGAVLTAPHAPRLREEAGDDQADVVGEFEALLKKHKKKMKPADVKRFEKAFNAGNKHWGKLYSKDDDSDDHREDLENALDNLKEIVDQLKDHLNEDDADIYGNRNPAADMPGGGGYGNSMDRVQQRGMPAEDNEGHHIDKQGPEDAEAKTPAPNTGAPPPPKTIAKSTNFQVVVGANEQVSLLDNKGNIRLSMPYVEWKQLARQ